MTREACGPAHGHRIGIVTAVLLWWLGGPVPSATAGCSLLTGGIPEQQSTGNVDTSGLGTACSASSDRSNATCDSYGTTATVSTVKTSDGYSSNNILVRAFSDDLPVTVETDVAVTLLTPNNMSATSSKQLSITSSDGWGQLNFGSSGTPDGALIRFKTPSGCATTHRVQLK